MDRSGVGMRRSLAAIAVAALLVSTPAVAEAGGGGHGRCTPGAPGVGDEYYPTYGNGGYDVRHYDLDLSYDPATDVLDGTASLSVRATQSLCSFNLDLVGLDVRRIEVDGRQARWSRDGQELTVTPRRSLREGERFEVTVDYDGVPVEFTLPGFGIPTGWMTTDDGAIVAGQPEAATAWFPVNDHPLDKASYSFEVRVPDGYEVVANGHLRGQRTRRGWTTWRWDAPEPMASYLATIDIGYWDVDRWRTESGLPVYDAVDTAITGGLRQVIDASLARQGEIVDFLSGAFGPYPFSTTGAIVDSNPEFLFALETQTRPVYATAFWGDAENPVQSDWVVVHELAHQWFGDDVALARWQDIWLNEGFATYAEWIWQEHDLGIPVGEWFRALYESYPADDPFWSVVIGDPGIDLLFDGAVYERGGMTLQALREAVGDDAFWEIVQTWAAENSGGHGTTDEFIALAEEVSGQQLDALFDAWLFTPSRPALDPAAATAADADAAAAATAATAPVSDEVRAQAAAWQADLHRRLEVGPH